MSESSLPKKLMIEKSGVLMKRAENDLGRNLKFKEKEKKKLSKCC